MTQVRIRHADDAKSQLLGDVPLTDDALESVLALVKGWGIQLPAYSYDAAGEQCSLIGQFVLDETGAFFEVVVLDPDE